MLEHLFAAPTAPFAVALAVMLLIAIMEAVGMMFGLGLSGFVDSLAPEIDLPDADVDVDVDVDIDADIPAASLDLEAPAIPSPGIFSQFLGWLCIGRVPVLVLLVAFLTAFGLTGLVVQGVTHSVTGFYLPALIAVFPAFAAALPATRYLGLALGRIMPKEETEAVSREKFVGKVATITRGVAKRGLPAEAKLYDHHGQAHYVLVEPDADGDEFSAGSEVLIVRQTGATFLAIANTHAALSDDEGAFTPTS